MADFETNDMAAIEMTPDAMLKETSQATAQVMEQLKEVEAAAAAISDTPMIDLGAEEKPVENPLAKYTPDEQRQDRKSVV